MNQARDQHKAGNAVRDTQLSQSHSAAAGGRSEVLQAPGTAAKPTAVGIMARRIEACRRCDKRRVSPSGVEWCGMGGHRINLKDDQGEGLVSCGGAAPQWDCKHPLRKQGKGWPLSEIEPQGQATSASAPLAMSTRSVVNGTQPAIPGVSPAGESCVNVGVQAGASVRKPIVTSASMKVRGVASPKPRVQPVGAAVKGALPTPGTFKPGLTVITCTRNRPEAFKLLERWMGRQTRKWDQWIVVNDGQERYQYTLAQEVVPRVPVRGEGHSLAANLLAALPRVRHEHIVFVEDDDWLGPKYLESMTHALQKAPLAGNVPARYYNIATKRWQDMRNRGHASLGQTAIHFRLLPVVAEISQRGSPQIDLALWRTWSGKKCLIQSNDLHVGIKGMPGENGIGVGHHADFGNPDDKPDAGTLRGWIGEDANAYLRPKMPPTMAATERPQIGCVIACHNYGRYLRECMESCLGQTVPFAAIVVVDDASTDNTEAVAKRYVPCRSSGGKPVAVGYVHVDLRNAGGSRNAGYRKLLSLLPDTTHVIFVDADNTLDRDCVATLLPELDDMRVGVAYGNLLKFGDRSGLDAHIKPWSPGALQQYNIVDACALIRREALDQLGGWETGVYRMEDWLTWSKMEANGWRFAYVPAVTVRYRVHRYQKNRRKDLSFAAVRHAWRIAIVTPLCGRRWALDRYENTLRALDWPRENLFVVAVDNSNSEPFSNALREVLGRVGIPHVVVPYPAMIDGTPGAQFADDAGKRTKQRYEFNLHVGRLWAIGRQFLPAWATHVWTLEDDIEPGTDALNLLAKVLWRKWSASVVSGFARSRFAQRWMVFRGDQSVMPTEGIANVDCAGFYCALWRRPAFDGVVLVPSHSRARRGRWFYDWVAYDSVRLAGGSVLAAGNVVCKHWTENGVAL